MKVDTINLLVAEIEKTLTTANAICPERSCGAGSVVLVKVRQNLLSN